MAEDPPVANSRTGHGAIWLTVPVRLTKGEGMGEGRGGREKRHLEKPFVRLLVMGLSPSGMIAR